jgi:hypothetical protein
MLEYTVHWGRRGVSSSTACTFNDCLSLESRDPSALAARADRLWDSYGKQQQEIAVVEAEKEGVTAIFGQGSSDR